MNMRSTRKILLAGICSMAAVVWAGPAAATPPGWKIYRSPDYGFTIEYPEKMTFSSGHPLEPPEMSMFPICDNTVACFQYDGDALKGTATQAAGISVNVLRELKTDIDCNTIKDGSAPTKTIKIHGTLFHYGETGEGGLGSSRGMTEYRTFYQHVCFEVAVVNAVTDLRPEDVGQASYRPVNRREWRRFWDELDRMLHSFTFVGPVRDGPDWDVYSDSGCGGSFEHPSASTLQEVVKFSNEAFNSARITCEQSFAYKGREYTVAVKANLRGDDALDEWLSSSGYPGLEQIKVVAKGDAFTEYSDQTYTYIRLQNNLFIFTVSGANHRPIAPEGDPVFAHLLGSFRR